MDCRGRASTRSVADRPLPGAIALFFGSWLSAYFIIATIAFTQHPAGHALGAEGALRLADLRAFLFNPWAPAQYAHNMASTVVTASVVMAAMRALSICCRDATASRLFLRMGLAYGLVRACSSPSRPGTPRPSSSRVTSRSPEP